MSYRVDVDGDDKFVDCATAGEHWPRRCCWRVQQSSGDRPRYALDRRRLTNRAMAQDETRVSGVL
jgi:hypothetical protein